MCNVKIKRQKKSHTCGHACIAMLADKDESEIHKIIGHSKGTKTKEMVNALNSLNINNTQKLIRFCKKNSPPHAAILKVIPSARKNTSGGWHWMLKYGYKIYDPLGYTFESIELLGKYRRITSFIGLIHA